MFRKSCAVRVAGTRFYVPGHVAKKYSGGPKIFGKGYLSKVFVAKMKKTFVIISQK